MNFKRFGVARSRRNRWTKRIPKYVLLLFFSLHSNAVLAQPVENLYRIDDGTSEDSLGIIGSGDFMWGNYFYEEGLGKSVGGLRVSFGELGVAVGTPFQVAIYEDLDDDGDPSTNLKLLSADSGVVLLPEPIGVDSFQRINLRDVLINDGFFVAVFFIGVEDSFPAKIDESTNSGSSWIATSQVSGSLSIEDPFGSATDFGMVEDFKNPGNFLVRADGFSCLKGDVNQDGVVNLLDVVPFVELVSNGTFQCEADINL